MRGSFASVASAAHCAYVWADLLYKHIYPHTSTCTYAALKDVFKSWMHEEDATTSPNIKHCGFLEAP